jgi:hypothetical protein
MAKELSEKHIGRIGVGQSALNDIENESAAGLRRQGTARSTTGDGK